MFVPKRLPALLLLREGVCVLPFLPEPARALSLGRKGVTFGATYPGRSAAG